jgi:tetratricopeptide (TPR) repeat protein
MASGIEQAHETALIEKLQRAVTKGNDYWRRDDFQGMLKFYQDVDFLFEDAPPKFQRFYFCNLGIACQETGKDDLAKDCFLKALDYEGSELDTATINGNLANVFLSLGRADDCLIYLSQPEEYYRAHEPLTDKKEWAFRLGNALETKARALRALGDKNALDVADEAEKLLFQYCRDDRATGRAIRTKWACWTHGDS